jgi:hypothetical protein
MANLAESSEDGKSSGRTPGTGLGAVRRFCGEFDAFTVVPEGTAIMARAGLGAGTMPGDIGALLGVVSLPKKGEELCGDAWEVAELGTDRTVVLVADGLGHGQHAYEASQKATRLFCDYVHESAARICELIHLGLRGTRGAAIAVADVRHGQAEVRFAGIGNISASVQIDTTSRSMVSHNGTAGVEIRRIQEFVYPWASNARLMMHSDGLATHWQLGQYAGLRFKHPAVIAGVLYRDHRRDRDDVTILALGAGKSGTT